MLSSFPPTKCGIGAYAEQQARKLEKEGHEVFRFDVHALNMVGWKGATMRIFEGAVSISDKTIVQYQPSLIRSPGGLPLFKSLVPYARLRSALRENSRGEVEIVVHEDFKALTPIFKGLQRNTAAKLFDEADTLTFHTRLEANMFTFQGRAKNVKVVAPEAHYVPFTNLSVEEARDRLGINQNKTVFVTAGFYHPGKGFERLVKSFFGLSVQNQLYIVTSDRQGRFTKELDDLRSLARPKNIHIINRYVDDNEFDNWLQAADVVVVPYVKGFTSSILARARLYDKPCIASRLPAIEEQADNAVKLFSTDEELVAEIRRFAE